MDDKTYKSNRERTIEYLQNFTREKVLKKLVNSETPTLIDVGANFGQTIEFFMSNWPKAKIIAFEPQHECLDILNSIKEKFSWADIQIILKACGNRTTTDGLKFYTHKVSSGLSGFNRINKNSEDSIKLEDVRNNKINYERFVSEINHERTVQTIRLDEWLIEHNISKVDLLKIDTQGYEQEVLEGMGEQLAKVRVVLTELMFYDLYERSLSFSDIEKYLHKAGLKLYDISHISKNPMNGRTDWVDVIYLNKNI